MEKINAHCFIRIKPGKVEDVVEGIRKIPGIKYISITAGDWDGVMEIEVEHMSELYELYKKIERVEGIVATNTHIVMKRFEFE